jgi:hypothetical protein
LTRRALLPEKNRPFSVVISLPKQFHPFVALGSVTVQAVVGVVPTLIENELAILAAEWPQPLSAIVGAVGGYQQIRQIQG